MYPFNKSHPIPPCAYPFFPCPQGELNSARLRPLNIILASALALAKLIRESPIPITENYTYQKEKENPLCDLNDTKGIALIHRHTESVP